MVSRAAPRVLNPRSLRVEPGGRWCGWSDGMSAGGAGALLPWLLDEHVRPPFGAGAEVAGTWALQGTGDDTGLQQVPTVEETGDLLRGARVIGGGTRSVPLLHGALRPLFGHGAGPLRGMGTATTTWSSLPSGHACGSNCWINAGDGPGRGRSTRSSSTWRPSMTAGAGTQRSAG